MLQYEAILVLFYYWCAQTRAWISVVFYRTLTKSGINIVEWSVLNANVLDFRYVFALSNYGANCLRLSTKNCKILGFSATVRFRGHFDEIAIAKVLLNTKPRRVGKVSGMSVFRRLRKCGERKKIKIQNLDPDHAPFGVFGH